MGADEDQPPAPDAPTVAQIPPGMCAARRIGAEGERFGPLLVERYVKDDGRELLLCRHARAGERNP
jgi:hypothetical protein